MKPTATVTICKHYIKPRQCVYCSGPQSCWILGRSLDFISGRGPNWTQ